MRSTPLYIFLFLILGCSQSPVQEGDLHWLNGYWEISQVDLPGGGTKEYTVNPTVDFLFLEGHGGYRKKMRPDFDGTFATSRDVEEFTLSPGRNGFIFQYKKGDNRWEETLTALDSLSFSVVNAEGIGYTYKRFEPIKIPR